MPKRSGIVVLLLAPLASAATPPDFVHDIAPLIYSKCAPCHHPGAAAPFSLLTYQDVHKRAAQIAAATKSRYMPPWLPEEPPEAGFGNFQDDRRLTPDQIEAIQAWVHAGAPEGPSADLPPVPSFDNDWQLGQPDLVLDSSIPVELPAAGPDLYWNVIFTPNLTARRWVRAIEIRPGLPRVVHHANLLIDRLGSARLHEKSTGRGFPGMDLEIGRSPFDLDGNFLFWKPGNAPHIEPDGFAWHLDPGNDLVLNMHLQPSGKPEHVRPSIGLYFTDHPQTKFPLLVELENDQALDIPAEEKNFAVADSFSLPLDADILAVYPHAHYLGHLLEAYATLPDSTRKSLIRIPGWDPNWQAVYYFHDPLFLPKGSIIHMRYLYDNSAANPRNPNHPPKHVLAGNQATDEMAHLWLQILPRAPGDHRRELQEAVLRHRIEKNPSEATAHMNLGAILLSRLDPQRAISELRTAARLTPNRPEVHNMLGLGLAQLNRNAEAIPQFELALRERPDYYSARFNLANSLAKTGKVDQAIANLRKILASHPDDPYAKDRLDQLERDRTTR